MAGDPTNARLWPDADVWIATNLETPNPGTIDDPFDTGAWDLVGLLDGDQGFTESREEETNDIYAWGGILVRTSRRNFKLTKSFVALEDNETTRSLVWPGSTATQLVVPRPASVKVAFETREGNTVKRLITAQRAEIEITGDITDSESDLTRYELTATIFPTSAGVLFIEQTGEVAGSS